MKDILRGMRDKVETPLLKRAYLAKQVQGTGLELRLDLSAGGGGQVRAEALFSFRPRVHGKRLVLGFGDAKIRSVTWQGAPIKARMNAPYLVLSFPKVVEQAIATRIQMKYTYYPDEYGSIRQPITGEDFPQKLWLTCRRPFLAVSQGVLGEGKEHPPLRTFEWTSPRSRRLNAVTTLARSFRKQTSDGISIWLHVGEQASALAPRLLELMVEIYEETKSNHGRGLKHENIHVVESDNPHAKTFTSSGLIVVPKGSFATDDKPLVYGLLVPEFNKEWGRHSMRLQTEGFVD